ncbi:MAG: hypothetical protein K0S90_896 [Enterobacteriaceae bacterium]|uniref:hypothetical protein n=1 Tax=Enterobacteriaceae TaxID=543 RepID=UPI000E7F9283|nr:MULTISPECIES: hypothetical protein [Enterobacteriaceae]MDF2777373.1 hypothetical protein [Enterobacteriaceae bacterium]WPO93962.1 hypothetical protein SFA32_13420 [Buttiauxella sp. HR94]HAZ75191.1 hypothetical protein [Enterobacteriaceae bacterium]
MENLQLESSDDIHALIGQMASQMLNTGKPLEAQNMMAFLQEQSQQIADGMRKQDYVMAMRAIADRVR